LGRPSFEEDPKFKVAKPHKAGSIFKFPIQAFEHRKPIGIFGAVNEPPRQREQFLLFDFIAPADRVTENQLAGKLGRDNVRSIAQARASKWLQTGTINDANNRIMLQASGVGK
jgi:hypothetical protein